MGTQDEFDFESFKKEAIAGLYSGKMMTGTDGVLAPMMKHFLESMMAGELDHHLSESKRLEQPNRRNGNSKKTVRSLSLILSGFALSVSATCITCSKAPNNGKCYDSNCSADNTTGTACCGQYIDPPAN